MSEDALVSLMPEVRTLTRPISGILLAARQEIQRNPSLQSVFQRARKESWPIDRFAAEIDNILHERIEGSFPEIREVSRFLADEYMQLGDGIYIVSRETAKVIYRVTEDDLWQPPMTVREDGRMVVPPPRIRPELEGYLVQWAFDEARDIELRRQIQEKLPTTPYLAETGDARLLPVTRAGRKTIVEEVRGNLSTLIPDSVRGVLLDFLGHFDVLLEDPKQDENPNLVPLIRSSAIASGRFGIQDPKAFNLHFDQKTAILNRIAAQWIAEIGRNLSVAAHRRGETPSTTLSMESPLDGLSVVYELSGGVWVMNPSEIRALEESFHTTGIRSSLRKASVVVEGARATQVRGGHRVGVIVLHPDGYDLRSREVHDRWEIVATCEYTLWVDWNNVRTLELTDIPVVPELV